MHNPWALSPRETQILRELIECGGVKAVARSLDMNPNTVSSHLNRVCKKMGVTERLHAALKLDRYARQQPEATGQ